MAADIELNEDSVRITDGTLEVDGNQGLVAGDGSRFNANWMKTGRVFADDVQSSKVRSGAVEIGTASPSEPADAGTAWVVDRHGADRIYLNGGEGGDAQEDQGSDSGGTGGSDRYVPWRGNRGWQTVVIPRERLGADPIITYLDNLSGEQDEREEAPDTVRVYVEGDAGSIGLGGDGVDGDLVVTNAAGETVVHINGDTGDITLNGLDKPVGKKIAELEAKISDLQAQL